MPNTIDRPRTVDKSDPRYFSIKTRGVKAIHIKAEGDQPERYLIQGTASSSVEDRYGDILTEACQASMLSQASGLTMWLNHSYDVPEDIAGTCVDPTLQRATATDGTTCLDLLITLEIDPENPRAFKAWQHVNRGTKLAFSIGGYFTDFDVQYGGENDDFYYKLIVNDVELLEISLVGIPANPRAYTKAFEVATEALRAEVVKRAEQIVKDARDEKPDRPQVRMLIRKSFGLSAEEVDTMDNPTTPETEVPDDQCAFEGCTEKKIGDTTRCATHPEQALVLCSVDGCEEQVAEGSDDGKCTEHVARDASDVNDQRAAIKSVEEPAQQSALVECMKSMCMAVGHGMCQESATHVGTAHAIAKAMLPDDYDLPDDATLNAKGFVIKVAVKADTTEIDAALEEARKQLDALRTEYEQLSSGNETLKTERTELEVKIAELKATPTGRLTKSLSVGSSNGSESTVTPEMYNRTATEQAEAAGRQMRGTSSDARSAAQPVLPTV